jgi:hypothetical protein
MHGVMRFVGDASGLSLARPSQARKRAAEPASWSVPHSPASVAAAQPTLKHPRRHAPPAPLSRTRTGSLCSSDEQDESDDDEADDEPHAYESACVDEGGAVTYVPSVPPHSSLDDCNSDAAGQHPCIASSIRLNVGGVLHQTSLQTLLSPAAAGSYFAARFGSAHFRETASPFDGAFFIDRDGTHFRHILNWLRDATPCALSDLDALCQLKMEADFYQLQGLQAALAEQIADIRLERMRLPDVPARRTTALPPPPPPQPLSRSMIAARAAKPGHRNLFVSNWGAPLPPSSHASAPFADLSHQPLQSYLQQLPSLLQQPPHSAHIPVRTHSCPSGSHAPLAVCTPRRGFASPHPMHGLDCTPVRQRNSGGYHSDNDDEEGENRPQQSQYSADLSQSRGCSSSPFEFSIDEDF